MNFDDYMAIKTAEAFESERDLTYCIFTKPHHVEKIVNFLNQKTDLHYTITSDKQEIKNFAYNFDVGVSYCCPHILNIDSRPFYNYHPAPLPHYKGQDIYARAIRKGMRIWGVTLHRMTEKVDEGEIIKEVLFEIEEPCSTNEIGTISHAALFKLFRETIMELK